MTACPKCENSGLVHTLLAESLPAHSCRECGGTLLGLVTYRRWRDLATTAHEPIPGHIEAVDPSDTGDAIPCPKCQRVMTKYRISASTRNRIDYCVACEEIWLDDGEWDLVANLVGTARLAAILSKSWQYRIQTEQAESMEAERLKSAFGSDYERIQEIREWLKAHPARAEIIAFLGRQ